MCCVLLWILTCVVKERLKSNSSAFDGLLSLIPAKYYYDDDTQEQWKAKKQSKEDAHKNKRAKLDPELSRESEKAGTAAAVLKKRAQSAKPVVIPGQKKQEKAQEAKQENERAAPKEQLDEEEDEEEEVNFIFDDEGNEIVEESEESDHEEMPVEEKKNGKDLSDEEKRKKEESIKALREKLASKITFMKEKRKAPGSKASGAPSSREAILEERRKKAEARAERKRRRLQEEGDDDDDDDDSNNDDDSEAEEEDKSDNVIYQNIVFDENTRATSDLQNVRVDRKKGPAKKDLKAHLKLVEQKKQKLENLSKDKKQEIAERENWNRTLAAAEGQKLRDDEKLLKKAIKRKEAQKRRSEIEWRDRKDHVENQIKAKQKRREENLAIRKANKGVKRKNQIKQLRTFKTSIAPKRAGFEGRRRTKK